MVAQLREIFISVVFHLYDSTRASACLDLFDSNCPTFFATEERHEYAHFLSSDPSSYFVGLDGSSVVCAFGYSALSDEAPSLNWIMVDPAQQRSGLGAAMMKQYTDYLLGNHKKYGSIATSQHAEQYFKSFGAERVGYLENGWGAGMHRVEMRLPVVAQSRRPE